MQRDSVLGLVLLMSFDQLVLELRNGLMLDLCQGPFLFCLLRYDAAHARLPLCELLVLLNLDDLHVRRALLVVICHEQDEARVIVVEELRVRDLFIRVRLQLQPGQLECRQSRFLARTNHVALGALGRLRRRSDRPLDIFTFLFLNFTRGHQATRALQLTSILA